MKKLLISLIIALVAISGFGQSSIDLRLNVGASHGINESITSERSLGFLYGGGVAWQNGLGYGWTPELMFNIFSNGTTDDATYSEYETSYMAPELRLKYQTDYFSYDFMPFIYTGLGYTLFNVDTFDTDQLVGQEFETEGGALHIPAGAGVIYQVNEYFYLDLGISWNFSLTEDLNPAIDDQTDANLNIALGTGITLFNLSPDSDGDGLSDLEEAELKTDPNNPDSDGDGLLDGEEVKKYKTNPNDMDTDNGGISDGIEVRNNADPLDYADDILSVPIGQNIIIQNLEFDTGKATIKSESISILENVLKAMKRAPEMEFRIVGHTDDVGQKEDNMKLSLDRANAVKDWLVGKGIVDSRLTTEGRGPDEPIVANTTAENRQTNRRVEFERTK
ncbi:MAG: hypothetical protein Kapaf2KO_06730 [Candidatus Kapaibacteriales bacterium]